eukprot:1844317-Prymnesium_polylepis.1
MPGTRGAHIGDVLGSAPATFSVFVVAGSASPHEAEVVGSTRARSEKRRCSALRVPLVDRSAAECQAARARGRPLF